MKRIELFWNILYYCTYTLLYSCFCAIDPHRLIDNKYTRKFYKKENIFWQVLDYMKRTEEREKDFSPFILMESIGGTCKLNCVTALFFILSLLFVCRFHICIQIRGAFHKQSYIILNLSPNFMASCCDISAQLDSGIVHFPLMSR